MLPFPSNFREFCLFSDKNESFLGSLGNQTNPIYSPNPWPCSITDDNCICIRSICRLKTDIFWEAGGQELDARGANYTYALVYKTDSMILNISFENR